MGDEQDDLVTVRTLNDSNQAAMLKALLEEEGFIVAAPGLEHRSMLGMAGSFVQIPLKVPRRDQERAVALLEALEHAVVVDEETGADPELGAVAPSPVERAVEEVDGFRNDSRDPPRRKRIAIFVACTLTFGAAHFYVRETLAGVTLLLAELAGWVVLLSGEGIGGAVVLGAIAMDVIGAIRNIRRREDGEYRPLSSVGQVLRTAVGLLLASALVGAIFRALPEDPYADDGYGPRSPDTLPWDLRPPNTLPPNTLPPNTLPPNTLPPNTLPPDPRPLNPFDEPTPLPDWPTDQPGTVPSNQPVE